MKIISTTLTSRESDRITIESGTPSVELMLNAAKGVFSYLINNSLYEKTAIVCGRGNNGGDGFALAYLLIKKGIKPSVFTFKGKLSDDAEYFYNKFLSNGGKVFYIDENTEFNGFNAIVDAIFGTGLNKAVEGIYADVINQINNSGATVISCDIASGLNADNGHIMSVAVRADITIAFGSAKLGHYLGDGRDLSGKLIVEDIGVSICDKSIFLIEKEDCVNFFKPHKINIHKGDSGKGGIIGGSKNFIGAPLLACMGDNALRLGSGLSYLGIPDCIYQAVACCIINNIIYPFKSENGVIVYDETKLKKFLPLDALAIGMGLGECRDINNIIQFILENSNAKLLLDADALNLLDTEILKNQQYRVIVTPHPKEFARLTKTTTQNVLENPLKLAKSFAEKYKVTVLLKGATTIITDGNKVALNTTGTPGMAKGGSGDLLDGVILGLLARGFDTFSSACVGAYIAGRSAELAEKQGNINNFSMLATDRVDYIGTAINEILNC